MMILEGPMFDESPCLAFGVLTRAANATGDSAHKRRSSGPAPPPPRFCSYALMFGKDSRACLLR